MFFNLQPSDKQNRYKQYLESAGSLSKLFSDSLTPYLYYRLHEKLFCKAFDVDDVSRSDVSVDAKKDRLGIGLKTFLAGNNRSFQKIAEFNAEKPSYDDLDINSKITKISELRNTRIEMTQAALGLDSSIYHCLLRDTGRFCIFEEPLEPVRINDIEITKTDKSSIQFNDGKYDYSFLLSKSTLTKRFLTSSVIQKFKIDMLDEPFALLNDLFVKQSNILDKDIAIKQTIYLPLYGRNGTVYTKSGLNQWNAEGRKRDFNEVYIPIPIEIHKYFKEFFPPRDTQFQLKLPDGSLLLSKVCQEGSKALMSYRNKELGQWILRKVLRLKEGELLTSEILNQTGIDSVRIDKIDRQHFEINFAKIGSYEEFKSSEMN